MKKLLAIVFLWLCGGLCAQQDKLYFTDGSTRQGYLVSIGKELVFFKASDTSETKGIAKDRLVMIEDVRGVRYLFAQPESSPKTIEPNATGLPKAHRKMIGIQPLGIFLGRATFAFEQLNEKGTIGIVIPLSITFDPIGVIYKQVNDTSVRPVTRVRGVNFIGGADLNFYFGKDNGSRFFCGPRVRYGTDVLLGNAEAFTVQSQFGWLLGEPGDRLAQHISVGVGFARILSASYSAIANPNQSFPWCSVNYRLSLRW